MNEIDSLIATLREAGEDVWIAGPQSEVAIVELEHAIGVTLPPSYRQFLGRFGGFGIVDSFISGIVDGKPLGTGTGWVFTDTARFRDENGMPSHLLVIQADEDAPYCLDTSARRPDGECPVDCYELHSRHVGRVGASFGEWFLQWLRLRAE